VRRTPPHFSWVDHRLVRDGHIERCGPEALALYLLLVTVGDAEGLSYYSDASIGRLLNMDEVLVRSARKELTDSNLVAYRRPLYQVLSLSPGSAERSRPRNGQCLSIGEILQQAMGGEA